MMKLVLPDPEQLPRFTFLGCHVAEEVDRSTDLLGIEELRHDLWNAVKDLLETRATSLTDAEESELKGGIATLIRRRLNPREFFYGAAPDLGLYVPVPLEKDREQRGDSARSFELAKARELTDLLVKMHEKDDPRGVLLTAGSGAGKTVACRKAFFDCLGHTLRSEGEAERNLSEEKAEPRRISPRLENCLPCWVKIPTPGETDTPFTPNAKSLIQLLLQSDNLPPVQPETLKTWLEGTSGPRLLLFFDLNAVTENRQQVAKAIKGFQLQYGKRGHRCIVTYRSTNPDDDVLKTLAHEQDTASRPAFWAYDLNRLAAESAVRYLRNVRRREQTLREEINAELASGAVSSGLALDPLTDAEIDDQCEELERLVGSLNVGQTRESLISTPLLMHFVASLSGKDVSEVATLFDLFHKVVEKHLKRERKHGHGLDNADILVAMTRIALAILSQGEDATRISPDDADQILESPELGTGSLDLWTDAKESSWPRQPYYEAPSYTEDQIKRLREFSFLRWDGESESGQIGFLHDSFVYYFAACALRFYKKPLRPTLSVRLSNEWARACGKRIAKHPERWKLAAEFLGGATVRQRKTASGRINRSYEAVHDLALELIAHTHKPLVTNDEPDTGSLALIGVVTRFLRGAADESDPVLSALQSATRWHGSMLRKFPGMLGPDVHRWLANCEQEPGPCSAFADRLFERMNEPQDVPWLRQLRGPAPSNAISMPEHEGNITCIAALPDGRIVTGSDDKTVKIWDPDRPDQPVATMDQHTKAVRCLAVLPADDSGRVRIASASDDGTVKVWDADAPEEPARTMSEHSTRVDYLAVLPADDSGRVRIASASDDGTVKVWDADAPEEPARAMSEHKGCVHCLAVLPADGSGRVRIASASLDGTVKVWDTDAPREPARTMSEHSTRVDYLAVLPADDSGRVRIASASDDGTVKVWDADAPEEPARTMSVHTGWVRCLAVLPADDSDRVRIASWSEDNTVKVWNADAPEEPARTMSVHTGWVRCLAVIPADDSGRVRIAWASDRTVEVWDPDAREEVTTLLNARERIVGVGGLPTDRIVIAGERTLRVVTCDGELIAAPMVFEVGISALLVADERHPCVLRDGSSAEWQIVVGLHPGHIALLNLEDDEPRFVDVVSRGGRRIE